MRALRSSLLTGVLIGAIFITPLNGCGIGPNRSNDMDNSTHPVVITPSKIPGSVSDNSGQMKEVSVVRAKTTAPVISLGNTGNTVLYLNEALAYLHYLPLAFKPDGSIYGDKTSQQTWFDSVKNTQPISGTFEWKFKAIQPILEQGFSSTRFSVVTEGALMTYQAQRGLTIDGIAGPQVWNSLAGDLINQRWNQNGYTNVTVDKHQPERLEVWRDGKVIYSSLANTGVSDAVTPNGTWPIYLRYRSQTMAGVTPWGEHYSDSGVPFVSYFHGGDAIHGFWRNSYGFPQSLGCVELPVSNSKTVYSLVTYGTLVTVGTNIS